MKPHVVRGTLRGLKTNNLLKLRLDCLLATTAMLVSFSARAVITGPYTIDANTPHLWHLNESGVPVIDAAPGGTNMMILTNAATLGNASFTGFGAALGTKGTNSPSS